MALTAQDRNLVKRCLNHESGAWNDFVDRYLGLVYHVIQHTAHLRSHFLHPEDTEDIAAEVMREIAANDYALLRQFRGNSSLGTYLAVIGRRICVTELAKRAVARESAHANNHEPDNEDKEIAAPQKTPRRPGSA